MRGPAWRRGRTIGREFHVGGHAAPFGKAHADLVFGRRMPLAAAARSAGPPIEAGRLVGREPRGAARWRQRAIFIGGLTEPVTSRRAAGAGGRRALRALRRGRRGRDQACGRGRGDQRLGGGLPGRGRRGRRGPARPPWRGAEQRRATGGAPPSCAARAAASGPAPGAAAPARSEPPIMLTTCMVP